MLDKEAIFYSTCGVWWPPHQGPELFYRCISHNIQYLHFEVLFKAPGTKGVSRTNKLESGSSNQGKMIGRMLFLLACIHPVMSCRASWIFHPSASLGSFGSSKQAAQCIQARIMCAHLFYLVLYILWSFSMHWRI